MVELVATKQPHFIPGYTGYCPQYLFRQGGTYGTLTHKLFIDPCVNHAKNINLPKFQQPCQEYQEEHPTMYEIDLIKDHEKKADAVYKHPIIPGYNGFVPKYREKFGERYHVGATEAIVEHVKYQDLLKCEARRMKRRSDLQEEGNVVPGSIGERVLQTTTYKMPLVSIKTQAFHTAREKEQFQDCEFKDKLGKQVETEAEPYSKHFPPHFRECEDPEKYIMKGYGGHVPYAWSRIGGDNKRITNSALCEFVNNYHHRKSPELVPQTMAGLGSTRLNPPTYHIYPKTLGMLPNYAGHVPGEIFLFGATFGDNTVNAKKWLAQPNF